MREWWWFWGGWVRHGLQHCDAVCLFIGKGKEEVCNKVDRWIHTWRNSCQSVLYLSPGCRSQTNLIPLRPMHRQPHPSSGTLGV